MLANVTFRESSKSDSTGREDKEQDTDEEEDRKYAAF